MGTAISLDLADDLPAATLHALAEETFAWLRAVDARFSTYREDSEVCRLDRGELPLAEASADLRAVVERCADLWRETDGYFDAYATGRLDPSGYVKGWSAQVASDRLLAAGAVNHCLNAGGDVRVRGLSASGEPWRIGVRHPWDPTAICLVLSGTDLAVATSGVYERGEHVLDPRRGAPARGLRSVTVVGPDLGVADAYATAAVAMGPAGIGWLDRLPGHRHAVVTDDARLLHSTDLPLTD
ncbi:thiamine biosynthesis protein [Micromonospora globispora]|uniref:FAD:protein FMN transferase n=1 Tax=Micromonospora globispora TaxID=1450148 RepID=A0A317K2S0_9ACTN|nr:FAD:protein FMN transferase [Micromonospora globispora]PWU47226.1 thiamine biosynthesis protein [Micromonospora globispora]PWU60091.1 thiamine biosynthesis protein [Micromonospora globispora]RQX06682.1 thiamine biosynthesis protein [Micromonospora globispora]